MITLTYFVHGTTVDNEHGLATGWLPGQLSPIGIEQSKKLGERLVDKTFDAVFCSDLQRAIDSAALVFDGRIKITQDDRLRECNYGNLDGGPKATKDSMMQDCINSPFPNGESYRDVESRLESFCDFLKQYYSGGHIAIVAHEAPQLALEVLCNGKSWEQAMAENWRKTGAWQPGWEYKLS